MKLKRIVVGIVAVTAAVVVAGYAIIASLDVGQVADFARAEVKAATGRDLVVAGPVDLTVFPTPSIQLTELRFANADWGSRPDLATISRLEIEVALLPLLVGDVVVRRLVAIEPDILLEVDRDGRGNWEFEVAAGTAPQPAAPDGEAARITLPDLQDFRIEGGVLRLVDAATRESLKFDVTEAVGAVSSGGGARSLRLAAAYNGNPLVIEGSYGGLRDLLSGAAAPVDIAIEAGGARVTARGTAGDLAGNLSADLAVTAVGEDLSALSPWAGAALPPAGPYQLSANVKASEQTLEISGLALKLAESDLTGNLSLSRAGQRPALRGTLVSKLLDLDSLTGSAPAAGGGGTGGAGAGGGAGGGRIFPDEPLPLDALRALDAEVKLDAERLRTGGVELEAVQTVLALRGGDLAIAPLAATLAGGSLEGRLDLKASQPEPEAALRLSGRDIDFGELLEQAQVTDGIGGPLELTVDLKGRGGSPHAIAASLAGHVQAVALDGTVDKALLRVVSAGLGDVLGPLFGGSESTRLECLVTRFDLEDGKARSRALVLDTGTFAVAGRGGIDLGAEQVSLAFDTETSQPSLASLAVPFRVTGPLADPRITPDPIGAAVGVVGTVGDVAKTGGNLVGGAVDTLGGLIGTGPIIGQIGSDHTLCGDALAAIGRGASADGQAAPAGQSSGGFTDDVGNALKDAGQGIERGLKSLFGN